MSVSLKEPAPLTRPLPFEGRGERRLPLPTASLAAARCLRHIAATSKMCIKGSPKWSPASKSNQAPSPGGGAGGLMKK